MIQEFVVKKSCLLLVICFGMLGFVICLPETSCPAVPQAADKTTLVEAVNFHITGAPPYLDKLIRITQELNAIEIGKPFSLQALQFTTQALKVSGAFREITVNESIVYEDSLQQRIIIEFSLTPSQLISNIKIRNASPLFNKEILNVMTIYVGDVFVKHELEKQAELIEQLYIRHGYMTPQVSLKAAPHQSNDHHVIVTVEINKGTYWSINSVNLAGNRQIHDYRLKLKMKTWTASLLPGESGRFIEQNLKMDIREMTEYYKKQKYYDININSRLQYNPEHNTVDITLEIEEGPYYKIEFEGSHQFWNYTLKKDVVLGETGIPVRAGIRRSISNMKQRYRASGFENVKINWDSRFNEDQTRKTLTFFIDEGSRSFVKSIRIIGNQAISTDIIEKEVLTRLPGMMGDGAFVKEKLMEDIIAIRSLYLQNGFIGTEVSEELVWSEDKQWVDITINITEGKQQFIDEVVIEWKKEIAEPPVSDTVLLELIKLKSGRPLREYMIRSDENEICALISELGYPHVKAEGVIIRNPDSSGGKIIYHIDPGPYVQMGQIYFRGNFRTRETVLLNELKIEPDMPFSLIKMLETQRNLRNMDVFNSVQFRTAGLKEQENTVHLFAEMEERKPYFAQFSGGYESQRRMYIGSKVGDRNLMGRNINAWISGELSEIGYRVDMGVTEPRLLGYQLSSTCTLFTERKSPLNQDFGVLSSGASVGFSKIWIDSITTGLNFQYERREQFMRDSHKIPDNPAEYEPRSILITTPSIQYDTRDSFISPKSGIYSLFTLGIHKGLENSLDDFLKYRFDIRYFYTPIEQLTLAIRGYSGHIKPFGSVETVPDDQLFYLGGTNDIRGFQENMLLYNETNNPLGGRTTVFSSLEARINLGIGFELTGFYDIGSIYDSFYIDLSKKFRSSVGLGLRYITPIGPIGFLYGFKLNPREEESNSRLHFVLGYTF